MAASHPKAINALQMILLEIFMLGCGFGRALASD
jgi:hypothetical protein